ncbi:hypothetical protein [Bradyrhizobium elkanii]
MDTIPEVLAEAMKDFKDPVMYESIVAVSRFEQNQLAASRPAPEAKVILERLQKLSRPIGTQIAIENGVGLIQVMPTRSKPR